MKRRKKALLLVLCLALLVCSLGGCKKLFFPSLDNSSSKIVAYDGTVYEPSAKPTPEPTLEPMVTLEPTPDYSYLNNYGFNNIVADESIWIEVTGYDMENGLAQYKVGGWNLTYHGYQFSDGYFVSATPYAENGKVSLNPQDPNYSINNYTVLGNDVITYYNESHGQWTMYITERIVDNNKGIVVLKTKINTGSNSPHTHIFIPAEFIDWSCSPEDEDNIRTYYFINAS